MRWWYMQLLSKINKQNSTTCLEISNHPLQTSKYHTTLFKVTHPFLKYRTTIFKIPHHPLQSTTPPSSKYHITIFKVQSSKYHIDPLKVPHHPLQSTTPPSSKYHGPHHPLQSTTPPSSKNHITILKVPHCIPHRVYMRNQTFSIIIQSFTDQSRKKLQIYSRNLIEISEIIIIGTKSNIKHRLQH